MKTLLAVALCVGLVGCNDIQKTTDPAVIEECSVVNLSFTPEGHGSSSGVGFTTSGSLVFGGGGVYIPPRYGAVLRCGDTNKAVDLEQKVWENLKEGGTVIVRTTTTMLRDVDSGKSWVHSVHVEFVPVK